MAARRRLPVVLAILLTALGTSAWPSMYTNCAVFPELGKPQIRQVNHPEVCVPGLI